MKRTLSLTLLFMFSLSATLSGCGSSSKIANAQKDGDVTRAPASASAPTAWGKAITDEAADFLDEVENAKARSY
jgi:uncharacterized protein YceK